MVRPLRIVIALAGSYALPAFAHFTGSAMPHWHAGDIWGVIAVFALTGVAAWIDRRGR
ncbi:MAG TPA: hypothetical protein VGH48_01305 [Caldimonas sp.]